MKILLSIKPEFVELILAGEKRYEFRRVIHKNHGIRRALIYATLPVGKVIAQFEIKSILSGPPHIIWSKTKDRAGLNARQFAEYFAGCDTAHALSIGTVRRFHAPHSIDRYLTSGMPPQSFCYVS